MAIGLAIGLTVVGIALWGIIGGMGSPTNNPAPPGSSGGKKCTYCNGVKSYYNGLSLFWKVVKLIWYGYRKVDCAIQGCPI